MRTLIECPDSDREGLTTGIALIQAGAVRIAQKERGLVYDATMSADRPIGPDPYL
jgi:hypothetical protein